ncbi:WD40 repeat-like protein [Trichoderma citrinoviride]|uniref:WD40 repeat-like protein n=1 Tax=Trichoderma citrinoviride TaxID=58853 RepID=A0A2T4BKH7_9HYPO|nr:WD40 repeat-like protein [Trichoderma citrinoviride]PTB69813.1 WD40 repeat-like protein [Trichoderma citrinoviride]
MSNPNPSILGSENYGLIDFLRVWAYGHVGIRSVRGKKLSAPGLHRVLKQATSGVERVYYHDLRGDGCDMQGLDWDSMNTTRHAARRIRRLTYKNYVNRTGSDIHVKAQLPSTDNFFRFRRMDVRRDISLAHFQLRSVLACPTRTHAYYPSSQGINVMNSSTRKTSLAMNLRAFAGMTAPAVSTLDAGCGVLMAGTFNGDYFLQSLGTQDKKAYSEGQISNDISGITNHIKIYKPRRSGSPVAAIASNDQGFRLLDLQTEKFTAKFTYPFALNCSAMSPDGRLRVVVGDDLNVLITNAETGEILQQLGGHRDYGFACDWSDNGHTVATGFQDRTVKIWDARYWRNANGVSTPIATISTEMAGVRNLRFSPSGSGRPVLAAAEEADFINLIDAQTFATKQTIDVFGEIGGVAFTNDGQDLNVLCCDAHRGGLLQFERCSFGVDEPLSGGRQRFLNGDRGSSNQWDFVKRRRPPMYMDGPGVF